MLIDLIIRRDWPKRPTDVTIIDTVFPDAFMLPRRLVLSAKRLEAGRWLVEHTSLRWWHSPFMYPETLTYENGIDHNDIRFYDYRWCRHNIIVNSLERFPFLHDMRVLAKSARNKDHRYCLADYNVTYMDVWFLKPDETGLDSAPAGTVSPRGGPMRRNVDASMIEHSKRMQKVHADKVATEIDDRMQAAAGKVRHPFGGHWTTEADVLQYREDLRIAEQVRQQQMPKY